MGMFDSLFDHNGGEWQTKAFDCRLSEYHLGDRIDGLPNAWGMSTFQVAVLGGGWPSTDSLATVVDGVLVALPAERDGAYELLDYGGGPVSAYRDERGEG